MELDLTTGERGPRGAGATDALLAAVPAAAAAYVTNNGAAALTLVAMALTTPPGALRELVIARGELVEIGDGFRIPALLEATGARLREVGTTNRVTRADYAAAIGEDTAGILKVHPSNFVVSGFTSACAVDELADLGVPLVVDIGSGLLAPHPVLPDEPDAATALAQGATVVTASGDKLLGGPQAGLVLGAPGAGADLVARIRRHPLARAMRVDKLILAALEATLRGPRPPVRRFLDADAADLRRRAERLAAALADVDAEAVDSDARVGGGGAPGVVLPSAAIALPQRFAAALRTGDPSVLSRIERGRCLLDLRAIAAEQDAALAAAVRACTS
ncbi:MAG: L-seryl-tRNA(Ser) seleniumtransferase [Pseudonocardiales bacterium]|nr:L-seryl-tRNA(Ser) seleniumtransferase [Pseudonocardiales bacterium]